LQLNRSIQYNDKCNSNTTQQSVTEITNACKILYIYSTREPYALKQFIDILRRTQRYWSSSAAISMESVSVDTCGCVADCCQTRTNCNHQLQRSSSLAIRYYNTLKNSLRPLDVASEITSASTLIMLWATVSGRGHRPTTDDQVKYRCQLNYTSQLTSRGA